MKNVEVVGIYHGKDKPSNCNDLLERFCNETTNLINDGIKYNGKQYKIKLHALVCDTPAKAYVLKIKYHTGYWSCTKCTIKGKWIGKVCFPGDAGNKRTDLGFEKNLYLDDGLNDGYQQGETTLADILNFGMVTNVVLDYMHLVCLGVMVKLIELWTNGPLTVRMSEQQWQNISDKLLNLRAFMPSDFNRKLISLENVKRLWKAHEIR